MSAAQREEITVPGLRPPLGHYSHAVRFGNLLFVTGCTGVTADGQLVANDVVEQTRQVFRNLQAIVVAAGASFSDVLKITTYLTDVTDQPLIDPVRREVFGQARPASTLVQVSALAVAGAKVEIDLVAGLAPDLHQPICSDPGRRSGSASMVHRPPATSSASAPVTSRSLMISGLTDLRPRIGL